MHIRPATEADIDAIVSVVNAAFLAEAFFVQGDRTSTADVRTLMREGVVFLVGYESGVDGVAAAVYLDTRADRACFGMLAVDPTRQGRGLARRLLAAVDAHAAAAGCSTMELTVFNVRTDLLPFYASCGYESIGTREFELRELLCSPAHLIVMEKGLGASAS